MSTEYELALPTMEDLPSEYEGEEALPDEFHVFLGVLLMQTFRPPKFLPDRYFSAMDMYLYYQARPVVHGFRPDWFGAIGVPALHRGWQRTSYVVWNEAAGPFIIVEAQSPGTTKNDLGRGAVPANAPTKWNVYEKVLKVPYYVTIDHHKSPAEVHFFRHDGERFVEVAPPDNRLWMPEADLGIGFWHGAFGKLMGDWVRFYDAQGNWIPTEAEELDRERKEKERARKEKERERKARLEAQLRENQERLAKERERAEKERLAAKLRELGIDPDTL